LSTTVENPVASVRATLQAVEAQLARPSLSREAMEDVKRAVDDLRLRVWANMTASEAADPDGVLLRFRLRRAIDLCRQVHCDLEGSPPGLNQRELLELLELTRSLTTRLSALVRGSA
jgi:hypothetical protein